MVGVVGRIPDEWAGATEAAGNGLLTHDGVDLTPRAPGDSADDGDVLVAQTVSMDDAETSKLPAQPVGDNDVAEPDQMVMPTSVIGDGGKHGLAQHEEGVR